MTFNPTDTPNIYPHKSIRVARSESLFTGYYGTNNGVKTIYIPTDTTIDSIINRLHAVHENGYDFHIVQVVKNSENANALNNAEIHYYLSNSNPTKEQYIYASARSFRDKNLSTNQDWLDAIQEAVSDVTTTESTNNDFVYNRIITVPDQNGSNYFSLLQNFADSLSTNNYIIFDGDADTITMPEISVVNSTYTTGISIEFFIAYDGYRSYNNFALDGLYN